ncbi:MAG: transcription-repair coupling factor [Chloroflexi bacterium]|nr:transcription-repair coupling factor [Chloroflexota bacterium]|tara:strand:+ start:366 stop:3899 length:3534 start_codon:yes stop_codon:yes gene_type:complete
MNPPELLDLFNDTEQYQLLQKNIGHSSIHAGNMPDSSKAVLISRIQKDRNQPLLVLCPTADVARNLCQSLHSYLSELNNRAFHFPESEILSFERLSIESGTAHERLIALGSLYSMKRYPPIIVTSVMGLLQKTIGPEIFAQHAHSLHEGDKISYDSLLRNWTDLGYAVESNVERLGTTAKRGGIIDIFSTAHDTPLRIDLWGDVIDRICSFDPLTQRSIQVTDSLTIYPAKEILPQLLNPELVTQSLNSLDFSKMDLVEKNRIHDEIANLISGLQAENTAMYSGFFLRHTLLDHLPKNTMIITNEFSEIEEQAIQLEDRETHIRQQKEARAEIPINFPSILKRWREIRNQLIDSPSYISLSRYTLPSNGFNNVNMPFAPAPSYHGAIDQMIGDIKARNMGKIIFSTLHAQRLKEILTEQEIGVSETESFSSENSNVTPLTTVLPVSAGFIVKDTENSKTMLTILTDSELFGSKKQFIPKPRRHVSKFRATSIEELIHGELVVHADHGIGKFIGTIIKSEDNPKEYLVLEYAENDRLYIPMEQLSRITPYSGGSDTPPSPTRLGTQEWARSIARARESTKKLAFDLLNLYAQRDSVKGFSHEPDSIWQSEMEDSFPFIETPDQESAINEVKYDMQQPRPMDRLICGDVGYGKTEVALRAVFKSVLSQKQAAILVPTTVLAAQHFQTISERLAPFPVNIELLSRFKTTKEQKGILQRLNEGKIDIIVGTHRLVQPDVSFKNLGIVVIDEEHRFGVNDKERLKSLREEVDVLSLSATPIPRTLNMALAGIRDISTIQTPPEERLPVRTFLAEKSTELIKEAIQREIDRNGQVFYLHNRVQSINAVAAEIQQLLPDIKVVVAHGQMPETKLSQVMEDFSEGDADVLVCTTIIESGLDIPNANTLIIENADRLGLAQLYQLRGRIGRRSERSYAYLLVEHGKTLTSNAQKRLETILAANELGAGFKIAMKDLEIRGAGNLLGADQSGYVHAIGFEMYTKLLAEAVAALKAQINTESPITPTKLESLVDLELISAIPSSYIEDMSTRMRIYQKFANIRALEDLTDLKQEIMERFGKEFPDELHNLFFITRIKFLADIANVQAVQQHGSNIQIRMHEEIGGARHALASHLGENIDVGNQFVTLSTTAQYAPWGKKLIETLENLRSFQDWAKSLDDNHAVISSQM